MKLKRGTAVFSRFQAMVRILSLVVCVIICVTAWSDLAAFGTGIPDTEEQQLGMLRFMSEGRVKIEVHDPEGNIASYEQNQIEGAIIQQESREMTIEIPHRIEGDYQLYVNPSTSANPIHLFDISVTDGTTTIPVAERILMVNAPSDPYVIRSSADGFTDVTSTAEAGPASSDSVSDDDEGTSSNLVWILAGGAGLLVAILLFLWFRKRKQ